LFPHRRRLRAVNVAEPAYASRRSDTSVVTVEVQPVATTAPQRVLEGIAEEAAASADAPA
jgi:hypothetical protein